MISRFYAGFSPEEIAVFEEALRRLIANLESAMQ